ncbi:hypothetical protein INR49_020639 [Caranx melampygus]|nr:hypothetical protein INR49_020639 [Caranx melampygus]
MRTKADQQEAPLRSARSCYRATPRPSVCENQKQQCRYSQLNMNKTLVLVLVLVRVLVLDQDQDRAQCRGPAGPDQTSEDQNRALRIHGLTVERYREVYNSVLQPPVLSTLSSAKNPVTPHNKLQQIVSSLAN